MKNGNDVIAKVIEAFESLGIDYFLAGSLSSNYYGVPRSTQDADFVANLRGKGLEIDAILGETFDLDPQGAFETVTGTYRETLSVKGIPFKIEIFHLSNDPHDQKRLERRVSVYDDSLGKHVYIPTAEDVIITKLRWARVAHRGKDKDDVRDIIAVVGEELLDWNYIHDWASQHGTRPLLDEIRSSLPTDL